MPIIYLFLDKKTLHKITKLRYTVNPHLYISYTRGIFIELRRVVFVLLNSSPKRMGWMNLVVMLMLHGTVQ